MIRRIVAIAVATIAAMALLASPASAASVHLKGGANAEPSFVDTGLSLTASGELAGLGNADVLVTLTAEADVASTCTNQGGNQAPGQNPAPLTVTGSVAIPASEIKNGNTPFTFATVAPDPIIAGAPGCPNTNWTEAIEDLAFTSAVITVEQPPGTTVLTVTCSISPASSDGSVPRAAVSCSSS